MRRERKFPPAVTMAEVLRRVSGAASLNAELRDRGFTTRSRENYRKDILDHDGNVVFTGRAGEVWSWLRAMEAARARGRRSGCGKGGRRD